MPLLFPAPREMTLRTERVPHTTPLSVRHDPSLPAEGFTLDVAADGISLTHADANGRRYGEDVLAQLRAESTDGTLPALRVHDAPDFPVRGFMLDVSRDRVPTRAFLERLVGLLARCRMNQLQLYIEHTFAWKGHEEIWRDASPLTPDDLRWLDDRCQERGIELVPNQNTFGHMGRWLRHETYRSRAEAPDGWSLPGLGRRAPAVLAPTPENARFALALVRELVACFRSRRVHIGCDETFELGLGRSRRAVEARGRGPVYLDHLKCILEPLRAEGHEVLFWGDILRNHPELVRELPRERVVALSWHYEAPMEVAAFPAELRDTLERLGVTPDSLRGFGAQVPAFAEAGLPFWVCPGTSSWNSLVGRWDNARRNLLDAVETGLASGAGGLLLTDWGDNGHLQPPSASWPALVYGAALAWGLRENRDLDVAATLDRVAFEDEAGVLGRLWLDAGEVCRGTGRVAWNASPLFAGRVPPAAVLSVGDLDRDATRATALRLDALRERAADARPGAPDGELAVRELRQALHLARHGAWRLLRAEGAPPHPDARLAEDLDAAIAEQRVCWLARSRPGGLVDSVARLEAARAEY